MDVIYDIATNKPYSIFSGYGAQLLKNYIKAFQAGGSESSNGNSIDLPIRIIDQRNAKNKKDLDINKIHIDKTDKKTFHVVISKKLGLDESQITNVIFNNNDIKTKSIDELFDELNETDTDTIYIIIQDSTNASEIPNVLDTPNTPEIPNVSETPNASDILNTETPKASEIPNTSNALDNPPPRRRRAQRNNPDAQSNVGAVLDLLQQIQDTPLTPEEINALGRVSKRFNRLNFLKDQNKQTYDEQFEDPENFIFRFNVNPKSLKIADIMKKVNGDDTNNPYEQLRLNGNSCKIYWDSTDKLSNNMTVGELFNKVTKLTVLYFELEILKFVNVAINEGSIDKELNEFSKLLTKKCKDIIEKLKNTTYIEYPPTRTFMFPMVWFSKMFVKYKSDKNVFNLGPESFYHVAYYDANILDHSNEDILSFMTYLLSNNQDAEGSGDDGGGSKSTVIDSIAATLKKKANRLIENKNINADLKVIEDKISKILNDNRYLELTPIRRNDINREDTQCTIMG